MVLKRHKFKVPLGVPGPTVSPLHQAAFLSRGHLSQVLEDEYLESWKEENITVGRGNSKYRGSEF